ncbi:hypothetical protein ACFWY9_28595 [Amycolatopsis sp. NPDC059027]|uniref:hypothetical protein n=1 Tax=Amycolatopsis sp. NPDC059027 TaxID=3346709 RepID=UPI003671BBCF
MDLYESMLDEDGNPPASKVQPPRLTEVGLLESLVMTMVEQLQAIAHYTAQAKGKPKITTIPRPRTAAEEYRRLQERAAEQDLLRVVGGA